MHWLKRMENCVFKIEEVIGFVLLVCMVVVVFLQVLSRYVLYAPFSWTEEVSRFLLIWLSFVGASIALKVRGHFAVEYLIRKIPVNVQWIWEIFLLAITGIFTATLFITGIHVFKVTHLQVSPVLQIPMSFIYLAIPVGFGFMTIHITVSFLEKLTAGIRRKEGGLS